MKNFNSYYPEPGNWQRIAPENCGFNAARLDEALKFAATQEIEISSDLRVMIPKGERHPYDRQLGPLKRRSGAAGLVLKNGYIVAHFGPVDSVEVTFSCSKSYLSAVAGLAYDEGLFPDLDQRVSETVFDGGFDSAHNAKITWRQLLQQTSEWEGELFGLPDWIDRGRQLNPTPGSAENTVVGASAALSDGYRELQHPGTFWEYNDVRVNRAALSLLRLFHAPLPEIIKSRLMDPIGASQAWLWHGYDTSWVEERGRKMQSVSGGAHWGGGVWIDSYDHARFGLLYLRRGRWRDRQIISSDWVEYTLTPCEIYPEYGLLWWLNHQGAMSNQASSASFAARGAGGNVVFVEPERDLVIVLRWCRDYKSVIDRILECHN